MERQVGTMVHYTNDEMTRMTREMLTLGRECLEDAGIRPADVIGDSYMKWDRADGGYVIFRANYRGDFGTLDFRWVDDEDGQLNGPFAPKSYAYLPWFARDLAILLEVDKPTRDQTRQIIDRMAKPDR